MPRICDDIREQVVRQIIAGKKQREVARLFEMNYTTVHYIWDKYLRTGTVVDRARCGRPMISTERDRRELCRYSKKNPFATATEVQRAVDSLKLASITTIKNYLRQGGLLGRVAAKKPLLSKVNIKKRLRWCKDYRPLSMNDWKNVIFSDECRIEIFSTRRQFVRRPVGQRFNTKYTCKTVRHPFSILVWGFIKGDGSRMLVKCPTRLDSVGYQAVLKQGLLGLYENDSIFMQDGVPCHNSKSTKKFLDRHKICMLSDWPPQSPDLNIIENVWQILKGNVHKRSPSNSVDLWSIVLDEWHRIPEDYIIKLYESIPRRLDGLIHKKGLHTKY
jgi:hypothetical protein